MVASRVEDRDGFQNFFKVNKFLLEMAGVLPMKRSFFVNLLVRCIALMGNMTLSLPPVYGLIFRWRTFNKDERTEIFSTSLVLVVVLPKILILTIRRKKLTSIMRKCEVLWESVKTRKDYFAVESFVLRGRFITYGFATVTAGAYISFLATPVTMMALQDANSTVKTRRVPFPMGFVPDDDRNFAILYAMQFPLGLITYFQIVGTDTLLAFFMMHACAHMRLVQTKLNEYFKDNSKDLRRKCEDREAAVWSADCIRHHQRILDFTDDLENLFSPIIFLQTVLSVALICFDGYNLLLGGKSQLKYLFHIPAGLVQLLMYCWPPDSLITESVAVMEAAYTLPWYDHSPRFRTNILFLMMRSTKPVTVTAAKFTKMSLEAYALMISKAFSAYTVLRTAI